MLTCISPCSRWSCLSGALNPARSRISLLASSWTYSLLADDDRLSILFTAFVAPSPIVSWTCFIMYSCTWGNFKALLAVTLPASPLAYPACCEAWVIVQPVATIVSTSFCCLVVSCSCCGIMSNIWLVMIYCQELSDLLPSSLAW